MPDARTLFPEIDTLDVPALHARYQELKAQCSGDPSRMDDDEKLREMVVILAALRRKSAGPPKAKSSSPRLAPPTLDQL